MDWHNMMTMNRDKGVYMGLLGAKAPRQNGGLCLCKRFKGLGYLLLLLGSVLFSAASTAKAESAEEIRKMVADNTAELVEKFYAERPFYETEPERFFSEMDAALSKIVDFRRIALRVMGKYARAATREQRDRFMTAFKRSLYETYTKTLIDSGDFTIRVTQAQINSRSASRASVDMEVTSDSGNVYPVVYSMYRDKQNQWLMENVIVFGVNIGLAFRDRFESAVRSNKGSIDEAIRNWNVQLDIKKAGQDS